MIRILLVEDNEHQRKTIASHLRLRHYEVLEAEDGLVALTIIENERVDLAICDVMMPHMDGIALTKALREYDKHLPILIVTAKGESNDKQVGFLAGTDDYMVKPIDYNELLLRITALLRRANIEAEQCIRVGNTTISEMERTIQCGEEIIQLPKREFDLLFLLLSYPGKIFTRQQLMDAIWGLDCDSDPHTVDVHIMRLRDRFKESGDFKITTVHGVGYRAEVPHA